MKRQWGHWNEGHRLKLSRGRLCPIGGVGATAEISPCQKSYQRQRRQGQIHGLSLAPPSSLLPGSPIGQTQYEAGWLRSLGTAPTDDSPCGRQQSRVWARMGLRAKRATFPSQREKRMCRMELTQKSDAGGCPLLLLLFLPKYLRSGCTR